MNVGKLFSLGLACFKIIELLCILSLTYGMSWEAVVSYNATTRSAWWQELSFSDKWGISYNATTRSAWEQELSFSDKWGRVSSKEPLDYKFVCKNHLRLIDQIGDIQIATEELYKWEVWFVGHVRLSTFKMRGLQMVENLLAKYPGLTIVHTACECEKKPFKAIIVQIKFGCNCWWKYHLDNIFILDVIDFQLGDMTLLDRKLQGFSPDIGVVISQTWRQELFWRMKGFEAFTIPHHTTITMKYFDERWRLTSITNYPTWDEKFKVGMHYSSRGSTNASKMEFDPNTTSFSILKHFHLFDFGFYNAELVWTKGLDTEPYFLYKPATRAAAAATLAIPVILHSDFVSHREFSVIRTDIKPYSYLTNKLLVVRHIVDAWVVDQSLWEKTRRHVFELSRCYHSELIADMYVRLFLYLIEKRG